MFDSIARIITGGFAAFAASDLPEGFVEVKRLDGGHLAIRVADQVLIFNAAGLVGRGVDPTQAWGIERVEDPLVLDGEVVEEFEVVDFRMTRRGDEPEDIHDVLMEMRDDLSIADLNLLLAQCRRPAMVVVADIDEETEDDAIALLGFDEEE